MAHTQSFDALNALLNKVMEPAKHVSTEEDSANQEDAQRQTIDQARAPQGAEEIARTNQPQTATSSGDVQDNTPTIKADKILGHYYRQKVVRFRASSKEFDMTIILTMEDMIAQHPELLRDYVRGLTTRAINTLIARHPAALNLLKRTNTSRNQ